MTKEEALAEIKAILPGKAQRLKVEETHCIGYRHAYMDNYVVWDLSRAAHPEIIGQSSESWEDALTEVKVKLGLLSLDAIETTI